MSAEMELMTMFNSELVDIVCIGSGSAGLAAAIAAADEGLSVFVAEPRRRLSQAVDADAESWVTVIQRHWGVEEFDGPTAGYLHELTHDLGSPRRSHAQGHLPIGSVESFEDASIDRYGAVPPFRGSEMGLWARDCLTSPYGLIFSRLSPLSMSEVRMQDGTMIRARAIAEIPPSRRSGMTLRHWLRDMAKERGVRIHGSSAIQRLLFSEGQPVGAVLETPDGIRHVRASSGVLLGTSNSMADDLLVRHPESVLRDGRLSLVSRNASRFARLELLTTAESMSLCAQQSQLA
ncbi:FAD-binding protein [Mycolicibacterium tusciae]|nr:FAD-binding protein [Mycolicibacterium tusciae]